ncbi:MAG: hypothetical protein ACKVU4_08925 [Phycisphaerales bacterium]
MPSRPRPLLNVRSQERASRNAPSPNDQMRTLIELLRRGGPELGHRWLAALMLVDPADREGVVAEIERTFAERYTRVPGVTRADGSIRSVTVVHPPQRRAGYIEQKETTYEATPDRPAESRSSPASKRRRA